jgi:4-amino-4-deoxy-L-arabinose transferase-like glycosyltransferase
MTIKESVKFIPKFKILLKTIRIVIGIILLVSAVGMFFHIENIKDDRFGIWDQLSLEAIIQICNAGVGDVSGLTWHCIKNQTYYYSSWILGILGVIFLIKSDIQRKNRGFRRYAPNRRKKYRRKK